MKMTRVATLGAAAVGLAIAAQPVPAEAIDEWKAQVFAAERAFAKTMADRDHAAFTTFIADDALFFSPTKVLRGRAEVAAGWKAFFDGKEAPFSWQPDAVEVLADGSLALSTGPVRDPAGKVVARFNSIWRREAPGVWRVVFDKGEAVRE